MIVVDHDGLGCSVSSVVAEYDASTPWRSTFITFILYGGLARNLLERSWVKVSVSKPLSVGLVRLLKGIFEAADTSREASENQVMFGMLTLSRPG